MTYYQFFKDFRVVCVLLLLALLSTLSCGKERLTYKLIPQTGQRDMENGSINLFLETSVSMRGYVNSSTPGDYTLKEVVPFLITDIDNDIRPLDLVTITDTPEKYDKSRQEFYNSLRSGELLNGGSSNLHNIFGLILDSLSYNAASILVSDCILDLGFENNMTERSKMTQYIYSKIPEGMSAAVFKFNSDFNGNFYFNRNNTGGRELNLRPYKYQILNERPFYIWVLGEPATVKKIIATKTFEEANESHLYDLSYTEMPLGIISYPRAGRVFFPEGDNQQFTVSGVSEKTPLKITVGLDMSDMPVPFQDVTFLKKALKIEQSYLGVEIEVFDENGINQLIKDDQFLRDQSRSDYLREIENSGFNRFVTLSFTNLSAKDELISLRIRNDGIPDWVMQTNLDDDYDISAAQLESKTFSFKYLIDAFERHYDQSELLSIDFKLQTPQR